MLRRFGSGIQRRLQAWLMTLSLPQQMLAATTLCLLLLVAIFYWNGTSMTASLARHEQEQLTEWVASEAAHMDDDLDQVFASMEKAALPVAQKLREGDQESLREIVQFLHGDLERWIEGLAVVGAKGQIIHLYPSTVPFPPAADLAQRGLFQRVFSEGERQASSALLPVDGQFYLALAVPLPQGKEPAALLAVLDTKRFAKNHAVKAGLSQFILLDRDGAITAAGWPGTAYQEQKHLSALQAIISGAESGTATCYSCHEDNAHREEQMAAFARLKQAPWVLVALTPKDMVLAAVAEQQQQRAVGVGIVLLVVGGLAYFIAWFVSSRTRTLAAVSRRIAAGNLDEPVPSLGRDDIGALAQDFEAMRQSLKADRETLEQMLADRSREISALMSIDNAIAQNQPLERVMQEALDHARATLTAEAGVLMLATDTDELRLVAHRGISVELIKTLAATKLGETVGGRGILQRRPVALDISQYPSERLRPALVEEGVHSIASAPLMLGDKIIGALTVARKRPQPFTEHELGLLSSLATQIAIFYDRGTLRARLQATVSLQDLTIKVLDRLNNPRGTEEMLTDIVLLIKEHSGCEAVGVRLRQGDDFPYYVTNGFPPEFVKAESSLCSRDLAGQLLRDDAGNPVPECMCGNIIMGRFDPKQPFFTKGGSFWTNSTTDLAASATEKELLTKLRDRCPGEGYESLALVPLQAGGGNLGLLHLSDKRRSHFTLEQIEFYEGLAQAIGIALQRQQTEEALKVRAERRAAINRITAAISSTLEMAAIFQALEAELPRFLTFDRLNLWLFEDDHAYLHAHFGTSVEQTPLGTRLQLADSPLLRTILENKPVIRLDMQQARTSPLDPQRLAAGLRSSIAIPVRAGGQVLGSLGVASRQVAQFSEADLEYLQPIADQLGVALAHARLFAQVAAGKQEWETTFDAMNDGVALLSPDLRIMRANRALADLTGTTPQTLVGQRCCEVMHGSSEPLPECVGMQCLAEKRPCSLVMRESRLGNRWMHYLAAPVLDDAGNVVRLIHIARDITELRQRQDDLERLNRLSRALASSLDLEAVLNWGLEEITAATAPPTTTIAIALLDEWQSGATFVAARGLRASEIRVQSIPLSALPPQLTSSLLEKKEPFLVHDISQLPLVLKSMPIFADSQAAAILPLATAERVIGALVIADTQGLLPDKGRLEWLQTCTNEIALAVENARLFGQTDEKLRHRVAELETLNKISAAAHHHLTLSALLQETLPLAADALGVERATVFLLEPGGLEATRIAAFHKGRDTASDVGRKVSPSTSPWLWTAVAKLETQVVENIPALLQAIPVERVLRLGLRSLMAVPLVAENRAIGTLHFGRTTRTGGFSREEMNLAWNIASYLVLAIENARLHQATEEERTKLESTLASMSEGLVLLDREQKVAYCNRAAQDSLGVEGQRFLGQPVEVFWKAWGDRVKDRQSLREGWEEAMAHPDAKRQIEFDILSGPVWRTIQAIPFRIGGQEPSGYLGTSVLLRDVTREREIDRMKTDFVSMVSHELRTPMTVVYGFAELLLKSKGLSQKEQQWAQRIHQESQRLTNIVEDVLDLSRIEAGRLSLALGPVALEPLAAELIAKFIPHHPTHSFSLRIPPGFPEIWADAGKLTQTLYNLVDNAVKYSTQGGQVEVSAREDETGERAIVGVADRGMGIPEAEMSRLFTRFHRVLRPETDGIRGTGLGLYIVKSLVDLMEGKVWVESEVNRGSTFYVALPLARIALKGKEPDADKENPSGG